MPVCPQCDNRQFANKEALLQHMKSSSAWHPFCSFCDRRFVSETAFEAVSIFILSILLSVLISGFLSLSNSTWQPNILLPTIVQCAIEVTTRLSRWKTIIVDPQLTQIVDDVGGDSKMLLLVKRYYLLSFISFLDINPLSAPSDGPSESSLPPLRREDILRGYPRPTLLGLCKSPFLYSM